MNLDELKGSPLPEPPERIKSVAKTYLKDGEQFNIFPQKAVLNEEAFYFVTYGYSEEELTGFLVVKEDGSLPLHKDCINVYRYLSGVETGLENVLAYGLRWSKRPMGVWKKLQSLLDSFSDIVNASNDPSFKRGYEVFCSIPRTMFETQDELKEIVEKAKIYYTEMTTDYIVTKDFYEKVRKNFRQMMDIQKTQFEVQIETEEERTQFMKKLKKEIPLTDARKWFFYLRLLKWHKWLNADKATMAEYEKFNADISREKATEQTRKELIDSIRNPRD